MANRILRDWTTSEAVDDLSPEAEVFFTRLIMKADDYGSYHANPKLIKAALFPLKDYTNKQIELWLKELIQCNIVFKYEVDGKDYIRIDNFGQRLRNMRNTFPQPPATCGKLRPETKRNETEDETEDETEMSESPLDDEIFMESIRKNFPNMNYQELWEKCLWYHLNSPSPPTLLWQWKQKYQTWLSVESSKKQAKSQIATRNIDHL